MLEWRALVWRWLLVGLLVVAFAWGAPAIALIDDDGYDGNIFVLYAGNGGIVPPRASLAQSLEREKPAILVFYLDDSRDCKRFSLTVSRLQSFYGRAASLIALNADALPIKESYEPDEAAYYYRGLVPQTVVIDGEGNVAFDRVGGVDYEAIDDALREVFDLLPRSESVELKRRPLNELNEAFVEESR